MSNQTFAVNNSIHNSAYEDEINIERCPHDAENPYAQINRKLIRDESISPECRWLIIYLLSNKDNWNIRVSQVLAHVKPHMGREKLYKVLNEAIAAGYIKREDIKKKVGSKYLRRCRYILSESPKFNKKENLEKNDSNMEKNAPTSGFDRRPENQDAGQNIPKIDKCPHNEYSQLPENQHAEKQHDKEEHQQGRAYEENKTSLKVSPNTEAPAIAVACGVSDSSEKKQKKKNSEFSTEVREFTAEWIATLKEADPEWITPSTLVPFMAQVDLMLRVDKRDAQKVMLVVQWALTQQCWRGQMFKSNPAKYLREKYLQMKNQMEAPASGLKKERKFLPCSDDNVAQQSLDRMAERAL